MSPNNIIDLQPPDETYFFAIINKHTYSCVMKLPLVVHCVLSWIMGAEHESKFINIFFYKYEKSPKNIKNPISSCFLALNKVSFSLKRWFQTNRKARKLSIIHFHIILCTFGFLAKRYWKAEEYQNFLENGRITLSTAPPFITLKLIIRLHT